MPDQCRFNGGRRRAAPVAASLCAALWTTPADAQIVADNGMSIPAAVMHDLGTAIAVIHQQLAIPFKGAMAFPVLLAMLAVALALAWPLRLWLLFRLSTLLQGTQLDRRLAIRAKAVANVLLTTMLLVAAGRIMLTALDWALPLLPQTAILAHSLAVAMGVIGLGMGIGRALRSPEDKTWRPVALPGGLGGAIGFYPFAAGAMLGLTNFIEQTARVLHAAQATWIIAQGLIVALETVLIARFLVLAGQAREREIEHALEHPRAAGAKTLAQGPVVPAAFGATALVWAALALGCGAFVFGYPRFAMLVMQELLWVGLVLTFAWLMTGFFDTLMSQLFDADWAVGRFATAVVGVRRARVEQIALIGSAVLTVLVWVFAIGLVAAPLHGNHAVVVEQIRPAMLVGSLQSLHLSPRTVGTAALVLVVGIVLTRMVRSWLENRFLPSTSLDIGVRTSLVTGLTYIGMLIAILVATQMLGLQLEKITLIASALSVGIGFGLQSIIQNFVSGVILLIERPVKVGDWVSLAGAEGTIRRIRVRATELATADGGTAIVPNSSFISSNVQNRADTRMCERVDLSLVVSGVASSVVARDALLELVAGCHVIRSDPAPCLYLTTLGDAQWTFALRVYAKPDATVAQARSELLFWLSTQTEGKDMTIRTA
jgi:small-conductance mechanosensitive channel